MWKIYTPVIGVSSLVLLLATQLAAQETVKHQNFGTIPLYFEENKGQTDPQARYLARSGSLVDFVLQDGWTLSLEGQPISMHIKAADPKATLIPEGSVQGITNYYLGSRSITALQHYSSVRAKNIRPGIDIVYHGNESELEYDLVIHPGADIHALWLRFDGSHPVLADNGDILLKTSEGEVRQHKPRVWQEANGHRTDVDCRYVVAKSGDVGFVLSNYDRSAELIVDPIISYSTFLGGTFKGPQPAAGDNGRGIAVDSSGFAYVTGVAYSADFPVTMGPPNQGGFGDVFVTKVNQNGTGLVYSTFIGGGGEDEGRGIAIDNAGNAYVVGYAASPDFPVTVNQQASGAAFVLKLDTSGSLVYSTTMGGGSSDGLAIAVDSSGSAYIAGRTSSNEFPTTVGCFQKDPLGRSDGFVVKLDATGLISYATYLGGSSDDSATAISVDSSGNAFVGGITKSPDFPVTGGAYSTLLSGFLGGPNAFIVKLNPAGSALIFGTYLGGRGKDFLTSLAIDQAGNCYVAGYTYSSDFPTTPGAFSTSKGSQYFSVSSGFVSKLSATGASLVYSTYLGGNGGNYASDYAVGIAVDSNGSAHVAGVAQSPDFPTTPGALNTSGEGMFLSKVAVDGAALSYSTLLGEGYTPASALVLDGSGNVYLVGGALSPYFPTTAGAFQAHSPTPPHYRTQQTGFVTKIDLSDPTLCIPNITPPSQTVPGQGGAFSFSLILSPGCPWTASAQHYESIKIGTPDHGLGSTSPIPITGTVTPNFNTSANTQLVQVGTATFAIKQDAGSCQDPVITPASVTFDSYGGTRSLSLTFPSSCVWTAASNASWLSITAKSNGTGPASITISAAGNNVAPRTATLTLAGKPITVTQTGSNCTATVSVSMSSTSAEGGDGVLTIATNSDTCTWHAYTAVPWIQMDTSTATGQGSGVVPFIFAANPGSIPRSGQILIADVIFNSTPMVMQDAGPAGSIDGYSHSIFAGGGHFPLTGDGGPALGAYLALPLGLAFDPGTGNLYIVDYSRIRVVTPDGNINTFAGGGIATGDNVSAPYALLGNTNSVAVDGSSSVYITDSSRIRKISQGNIVTFAGNIAEGSSGDNGPATDAKLTHPTGIAADSEGNIYIADSGDGRIRKVAEGIITTIASFVKPSLFDIAADAAGNLFITDFYNNRVRKIAQGIITTVAGDGTGGDGGPAASAAVGQPWSVTVDPLGNVFFTEYLNYRIHKISMDGTISTIADGIIDNFTPYQLTSDTSGNLYFSDRDAGLVHKLTALPSFCAYSVATPPQIPADGGPLQISVTTGGGCHWSALEVAPWLTFESDEPRVGNGTLTFTVFPNPNADARTATLAIAGQPIHLTQSGASTLSKIPNRSVGRDVNLPKLRSAHTKPETEP